MDGNSKIKDDDEASQGDLKSSDDSTEIQANAGMSRPRGSSHNRRRKHSDSDGGDKLSASSKLSRKSSSGSVGERGERHRNEDSPDYTAAETTVTIHGMTKTLIKVPGYRDVLLGRGRGIQTANGNYLMRQIIASHRKKYCSLMRQDRRKYSEAVLDEVLATGARFLQRMEYDEAEYWVPVDREAAHDKVSHSLREKRPSREHNIGDPLPPGHSSAQPDEIAKRRIGSASPLRTRKQESSHNDSPGLPNPAAATGAPQFGAPPHVAQQAVPPDVAATTVLLLQAIQSQVQQQQILSTMVQNMSQLQHAQQPSYIPQLDLTSQLSQLQAMASLNTRGAIPGSFFLAPPTTPHQPALNVGLPNLLAAQHQGFVQSGGMPVAANLNTTQHTRSTHQTVVGQASLNNLPNHQTQYASSILLQALMAANKKTQTTGAPQGNNNINTNLYDRSTTGEGGSGFEQI